MNCLVNAQDEMEIEDNKMKDDEIEDELEVNVGGDDKKSLYLAELSDFKMKIFDVLIKNNMNENNAKKHSILMNSKYFFQ